MTPLLLQLVYRICSLSFWLAKLRNSFSKSILFFIWVLEHLQKGYLMSLTLNFILTLLKSLPFCFRKCCSFLRLSRHRRQYCLIQYSLLKIILELIPSFYRFLSVYRQSSLCSCYRISISSALSFELPHYRFQKRFFSNKIFFDLSFPMLF